MAKNRKETDKRLKNLKTDAGPGRPKGQRNYATIYREALIKIGKANNKTPEEIEEMMEEVGMKNAIKGNFAFWKDIRDRIHGRATENVDLTSKGEKLNSFNEDQINTIAKRISARSRGNGDSSGEEQLD